MLPNAVPPDHRGRRQALRPRGDDVLAAQALQHERPGHAGDVGHVEGAQHQRRQRQMRRGVAQASQSPASDAVDQQHAGHLRHHVLEQHVLPPRPRRPAEGRVEHQQADQRQHEHRDRMPGQAHDPDRLVDPAALPHRRPARRAARPPASASTSATVASSSVAGKNRAISVATRLLVITDRPRSPCSKLAGVAHELLRQRPVQPHLPPGPLDHVLRRAVADHGQHRVDRHHAADQEGDQHQAEQRDRDAAPAVGRRTRAEPTRQAFWMRA